MKDNPPSDEMLMAFADGHLDPAIADEVARLVARDATIAARVEAFRETARCLSALGRAQDAAIPDTLIARIQALAEQDARAAEAAPVSAGIVDLSARRRAPRPDAKAAGQGAPVARYRDWIAPLAASVLLAVGLWGGFSLGQRQPGGAGDAPANLAVLGSGELDQALRGLRSGQRQTLTDGGELELIASFRNGEGQLCREFEFDRPGRQTIVSVACHPGRADAGSWSTQLAVLAPPSEGSGYAPASSLETLDAYLGAIHAGPPMSDDDEAVALSQLN